MRSVLAIDQGTTSTRALAVDGTGRVELVHSVEHAQHYPKPGWVEHDPEELLKNIVACVEAACAERTIDGVGLANQGESCLAWDASTGEAITPVIVWQDQRTQEEIERLRTEGVEAEAVERAGLPLDPYFSASKLAWIVREVPKARELLRAGRLRLGTTDAFFRDRLTQEFATDVTTASRTGLMHLGTMGWDKALCEIYGVPISALPTIKPSSGDLGFIASAGLKPLRFAASLTDQQAAVYGHGCRKPGDAKITCGTGAFMLCVSGDARPCAEGGALPTVLWQRGETAPVFGLDGGVYAAAAAVNWARRIGLVDELSKISAFEGPTAIERGIAFVPALSGLACPHWDRAARGSFVGLGLDTSRQDIARSILEGVALRVAEVAAVLNDACPLADEIPIDGGLSANGYFAQFLADCMGRTLRVAQIADVTALGVASLAAEAIAMPWQPQATGTRIVPQAERGRERARFAAAVEAVRHYAARGDGARSQNASAQSPC